MTTLPNGKLPGNRREQVYVAMDVGAWYTSRQLFPMAETPIDNISPMMHMLHAEGLVEERVAIEQTPTLQRGQFQWRRR